MRLMRILTASSSDIRQTQPEGVPRTTRLSSSKVSVQRGRERPGMVLD